LVVNVVRRQATQQLQGSGCSGLDDVFESRPQVGRQGRESGVWLYPLDLLKSQLQTTQRRDRLMFAFLIVDQVKCARAVPEKTSPVWRHEGPASLPHFGQALGLRNERKEVQEITRPGRLSVPEYGQRNIDGRLALYAHGTGLADSARQCVSKGI